MRSRTVSATEPPFSPSRSAAVLVLFTIRGEDAKVVLMRRPRDRGRHRGEWAFPGGVREESDDGLLGTAFRETEEELGIARGHIDFWGGLEPVQTVGTRFEVWPFVGWLNPEAEIVPSEDEVDEVGEFPVGTFTETEQRRRILLRRDGVERDLTAYSSDGRVVWGATARILSQIFDSQDATTKTSGGEFRKVVGQ